MSTSLLNTQASTLNPKAMVLVLPETAPQRNEKESQAMGKTAEPGMGSRHM